MDDFFSGGGIVYAETTEEYAENARKRSISDYNSVIVNGRYKVGYFLLGFTVLITILNVLNLSQEVISGVCFVYGMLSFSFLNAYFGWGGPLDAFRRRLPME